MASKSNWTAADIPLLTGRRFVITGANSGLGLRTAFALAAHGAAVTMTARSKEKGEAAVARVKKASGSDDVELALLDLADLSSVRRFAEERSEPIDVLIDNAGVMAVREGRTADGFETQFGTNHLGHFALTGLLLPALREGIDPRVVVLSSAAHRAGRIDFDDLQSAQNYGKWKAYGQSKLANLLFAREFARRLMLHGDSLVVASAHPGFATTNLMSSVNSGLGAMRPVVDRLMRLASQSDAAGALPTLYAATAADVRPDEYFGPDGFMEQKGNPTRVDRTTYAKDDATAQKLWTVSEELTGVTYPDLPAA